MVLRRGWEDQAQNRRWGPLSCRIDFVGDGGTGGAPDGAAVPVREVVLLPPEWPGAIVQWSRDAGEGGEEVRLEVWLEFSLEGGGALAAVPFPEGSPWGGAPPSGEAALLLAATFEGGPAPPLLLHVAAAPGTAPLPELHPPGEGAPLAGSRDVVVHLRAALPPGGVVQLSLGEGVGDTPPALPPRRALLGWERGLLRDEAVLREEGLGLRSPEEGVNRGVAWAALRLGGWEGELPGDAEGWSLPWAGLGALAAGAWDLARERLEEALERRGAAGEPEAGALLLAGRYALWTGDPTPLERHAVAVLRGIAALRDGEAGDAALRIAALTAVADGWEPFVGREEADRIRGWAGEVAKRSPGRERDVGLVPESASGTRRLPMLADSAAPAPIQAPFPRGWLLERALPLVLGVPGRSRASLQGVQRPGCAEEWGLLAWALAELGDADGALAALRRPLHTLDSAGGWASAPPTAPAATAGLSILALVQGIVGLRPEAAWGRIRLAPLLPSSWDAMEVANLRCGDALLTLACRREGGRHTFVLRPQGGRVPPTIVFEPVLSGGEIGEVRLGGEVVEVDRTGGRRQAGIRLQFPLDAERRITVDGAERG